MKPSGDFSLYQKIWDFTREQLSVKYPFFGNFCGIFLLKNLKIPKLLELTAGISISTLIL